MKIYTKTGDGGETGLFSGPRISKAHALLEAYGTVDELNSIFGLARMASPSKDLEEKLARVQNELFSVGADLATPMTAKKKVDRVTQVLASQLETEIDEAEKTLRPLTQFILPGGCPAAGWLHFARTVCRRAERHAVHAHETQKLNPDVLIYLNRLSDWCFVMARQENHLQKTADVPWKK